MSATRFEWYLSTGSHTMMTLSHGNIYRVTGPLCGEFTGYRWIPLTKTSNAELWFFFDLHLNKRLSEQPRRGWSETPSGSSWRQCNAAIHSSLTGRGNVFPRIVIRSESGSREIAQVKPNQMRMVCHLIMLGSHRANSMYNVVKVPVLQTTFIRN